MCEKAQLVFPRHSLGRLANVDRIVHQPPLGLLCIASRARQECPRTQIEVLDGRFLSDDELLRRLDAPLVGFSTWYSNYTNAISLARRLKEIRPETRIILGGPHATPIAERILHNNPFVDYVLAGEGEEGFACLVRGDPMESIPGIFFRDSTGTVLSSPNGRLGQQADLNAMPPLNLDLLRPDYSWQSEARESGMSGFPLAGIRGCHRSQRRCEYCSIFTKGWRHAAADKYWEHIARLHDEHGVDYFFETGDVFKPAFLRRLARIHPHPRIALRIYSFPGFLKPSDMEYLKDVGVSDVFIGSESVLAWERTCNRSFGPGYTVDSLLAEFESYGKAGIRVLTSFVLGLPGETEDTLARNMGFIRQVHGLNAVKECTVSILLPLPGSEFFTWAVSHPTIRQGYKHLTGMDLQCTDVLDVPVLSQLFVETFTSVKYETIRGVTHALVHELGSNVAQMDVASPQAIGPTHKPRLSPLGNLT